MVPALLYAALVLGGGLLICAFVYGLTTGRHTSQPAPTRGGRAFATFLDFSLGTGVFIATLARSAPSFPLALAGHIGAALCILMYLLFRARWVLTLGIGWGCIYFGGMFPASVIRQMADVAALGFFGVFLVLLCRLTMGETAPVSVGSRSTSEASS